MVKFDNLLLNRISKVLLIIAIGLAIIVIKKVIFIPDYPLSETRERKQAVVKLDDDNFSEQAPDFKPYQALFATRDLFKFAEDVGAVVEKNITLQKWGADYKLVGVIIDELPKAIIETVNLKSVQFLAVGDSLNNAVLEKIEAERVWFKHHDQKICLELKQK